MLCQHDMLNPCHTMDLARFNSMRRSFVYRCRGCRGTAEISICDLSETDRENLHEATKQKRPNRAIAWLKRTFQGPMGPPGVPGPMGPNGCLIAEDRNKLASFYDMQVAILSRIEQLESRPSASPANTLHDFSQRLTSLELKVRGVVGHE